MARRRPRGLVLAAGAAILAAELGRTRNRGREVFDRASPLFAPLWVGERAALAWVALDQEAGGWRESLRRNGHRPGGEPDPCAQAEAPFTVLGLNGTILCVPSQNGCIAERPHRQSALIRRRVGTSFPCSSSKRSGPRTSSGPSGVTRTNVTSSLLAWFRGGQLFPSGYLASLVHPASTSRSAPCWSSMQNRVAGRAASRAAPIGRPQASQVP